MSFLDSQLAGKYKGVSFLVRNETLNNVGQTRIKHKYPKTGVQYMEPMGQEPFSETIELFFSGENYVDDFESFKKAVQDPAPGRLYSPTFGVFNSIVANPSSFSVSQKSLGEISASVQFDETIDRPAPTESLTSQQDVSEKAQEARAGLKDVFSGSVVSELEPGEVIVQPSYEVPTELNNIAAAISDAKALAGKVKEITGKLKEARRFLTKIDRAVRNVQAYGALLLNPGQPIGFLQSIALSFQGNAAFTLFKQLTTVGGDLPNSMNDINAGINPTVSSVVPDVPTTGIDVSINVWDNDTAERIERNTIRLSVVNTFRLVGLIGMFESAAASTYTTTEEIDNIIATLEQYYEEIIENDTTGIVVPEMKAIIDVLRGLTDRVLATKRQQAFGVTTVDVVRPTSSFLLAYNLYGEYIKNESQLEFMSSLITGLNRQQVANRLQGTVKVVEIGR
jgi:hypothetical protein